jgi:hypothetical protein
MFSSLIRQTLLDAIASGPPYRVSIRHVHGVTKTKLVTEMERRRLITPSPFSVLTEAGIAEAKWLHVSPMQRDDQDGQEWPVDQRNAPKANSYRSRDVRQKPMTERW